MNKKPIVIITNGERVYKGNIDKNNLDILHLFSDTVEIPNVRMIVIGINGTSQYISLETIESWYLEVLDG